MASAKRGADDALEGVGGLEGASDDAAAMHARLHSTFICPFDGATARLPLIMDGGCLDPTVSVPAAAPLAQQLSLGQRADSF